MPDVLFVDRFANLPEEGLNRHHLSPPASRYWSMMAYNNAKLCNVLFVHELARVIILPSFLPSLTDN